LDEPMRRVLLALFTIPIILVLSSCSHEKPARLDNLSEEQFVNPPDESRPGAFWCWLNGNMTKESITRDLEAMRSKGITRAEIWDVAAISNSQMIPGGPQFLSDSSVSLIKHAIAEGRRLKMRVGIVASSGWNAGGSWVEPEWASKSLFVSETEVQGPGKVTVALPFPKFPPDCPRRDSLTPVFYKDIAVVAVPKVDAKEIADLNQIVDLTARYSEGQLQWQVPDGQWTVLRFVCSNNGQRLIVPSPNSNGLFIDFFDPEATRRHLQYFMNRLGVTPENSAEGGLAYFEFDSMELAEGIPWTDKFASIFKERRGYEIQKYLPILAGWKVKDQTDPFLYDFRKTVSEQLIFSHYRTGTEFLKQYHADLVSESGGPGPPVWDTCPVDALEALGAVSTPRGEFWIKHRNMFLVKEVSSAAHIYGKKVVDAESFTTWRRWKDSPFAIKPIVDRAFCEGLNNITFHTFASSGPEDGYPGRTYHAGFDMNPGTTWWQKSKPLIDYLSRCSYALRQGLFHADVCYYYGDQAPNFFPLFHNVPEKPALKGLGKGYDYDVINSEVILTRMTVKGGRLVLPDGMSYALLLLPEQARMPLEVLEKIRDLVAGGATVVGPKPTVVPGLLDHEGKQEKLKKLADELWGKIDGKNVVESSLGKGRVMDGLTPDEVLRRIGIKQDFTFRGPSEVDFIHRTVGNGDLYFVRNAGEEFSHSSCRFRVSGKYPEIWDPVTGKVSKPVEWMGEDGRSGDLAIDLPPHGSTFVFFNNKERKDLPSYEPEQAAGESEISGPWSVTFPPKWGAPPEVTFANLISWTDASDKGVQYFSGIATYANRFSLDKIAQGKRVFLDLGEMRDVAEVFVNGKTAGILWTKPFAVDITSLVKEGENDLKMEVVNMWVNRLVGDQELPVEKRYCRTNQGYAKTEVWPGGDEPFRLQTSGLLGPVKLSIRSSNP
jgi:hypothetical protein